MTRIDTDQSTVLQVVAKLLRESLDLDERHCYPSIADPQDVPKMPPGGQFIVRIGFGDGTFDDGMLAGAGRMGCLEKCSLTITICTLIRRDDPDHFEATLYDAYRGCLPLKKQILNVLTTKELLDADGNQILVQALQPARAWRPRGDKKTGMFILPIAFTADWNWSLTQ